jgi:hypothetical protein
MLKVQRSANGDVVFTVIGRLEANNLSELSAMLAAEPGGRLGAGRGPCYSRPSAYGSST